MTVADFLKAVTADDGQEPMYLRTAIEDLIVETDSKGLQELCADMQQIVDRLARAETSVRELKAYIKKQG